MDTSVNVLMDALGLSATAVMEGSSQTVAADQQSVSGEFLNLVQTLVEGQQDSDQPTDEIRAGQQTREEPEKENGESQDEPVLLVSCLLGSMGSVQQLPAQPENVELIQAPAMQSNAAPATDMVTATAPVQTAAPVAAGSEASDTSDKSELSDAPDAARRAEPGTAVKTELEPANVERASVADRPEPKAQVQPEVEAPEVETPKARPENTAWTEKADPPRPEEPKVRQAVVSDPASAPQADARARAVIAAEDPLPAPQAVTPKVTPGEDQPPPIPATHQRLAEAAEATQAPVERSQVALQTAAQATAEVVAPAAKPASWSNSEAVSATPDLAAPTDAPVKPVEKSEKPVIASNEARYVTLIAEPAIRADSTAQPAPAPAAHSEPAREIGTRVINQIVRSARTHFFEGGAAMTLRLDPPHLGAVRMSIVAVQGAVTAVLETTTETARHILQADLGSLREALAQSGMNLDNVNVSVNVAQDQTWNPYGRQENTGNAYGHANAPWASAGPDTVDDPTPPLLMAAAGGSSGYGLNYLA